MGVSWAGCQICGCHRMLEYKRLGVPCVRVTVSRSRELSRSFATPFHLCVTPESPPHLDTLSNQYAWVFEAKRQRAFQKCYLYIRGGASRRVMRGEKTQQAFSRSTSCKFQALTFSLMGLDNSVSSCDSAAKAGCSM